MVEGFDKEMDSLLRQTARGETVSVNPKSEIRNPKSHLDADEIAAFAENSLPEKTKTLYTEHFADCGRCRRILANVILLNDENPVETVPAPQPKTVAAVVPWYKRLFAVPTLAYSMGALVLVFAGIIAYTVFRSANMPQNSEISRVEPSEKMSGPNAGDSLPVSEPNASTMSSGSGSITNSTMSNGASTAANLSLTNPAAVNPSTGGSMSNSAAAANPEVAANKQTDAGTGTATNRSADTSGSTVAGNRTGEIKDRNAGSIRRARPRNNAAQNEPPEDADRVMLEMPAAVTGEPPPPIVKSAPPPMVGSSAPTSENSTQARSADDIKKPSAKTAKSDAPDSRQIGGKTFKRENGAWYDAAYKGQATINVSRGSEDFKKLDASLRSIAGSLSGTIVVVYNGRAYRIQ